MGLQAVDTLKPVLTSDELDAHLQEFHNKIPDDAVGAGFYKQFMAEQLKRLNSENIQLLLKADWEGLKRYLDSILANTLVAKLPQDMEHYQYYSKSLLELAEKSADPLTVIELITMEIGDLIDFVHGMAEKYGLPQNF